MTSNSKELDIHDGQDSATSTLSPGPSGPPSGVHFTEQKAPSIQGEAMTAAIPATRNKRRKRLYLVMMGILLEPARWNENVSIASAAHEVNHPRSATIRALG